MWNRQLERELMVALTYSMKFLHDVSELTACNGVLSAANVYKRAIKLFKTRKLCLRGVHWVVSLLCIPYRSTFYNFAPPTTEIAASTNTSGTFPTTFGQISRAVGSTPRTRRVLIAWSAKRWGLLCGSPWYRTRTHEVNSSLTYALITIRWLHTTVVASSTKNVYEIICRTLTPRRSTESVWRELQLQTLINGLPR